MSLCLSYDHNAVSYHILTHKFELSVYHLPYIQELRSIDISEVSRTSCCCTQHLLLLYLTLAVLISCMSYDHNAVSYVILTHRIELSVYHLLYRQEIRPIDI